MDRLNALCGLKLEKRVAVDLFTEYIRERVDSWSDQVFEAYLQYHFSICERPELLGITNHVLDILKK